MNDTLRSATSGWTAPSAASGVTGVVHLPGSKSQTNRVLVLAALADAPVVIRNPLVARDSELMALALGQLGSPVEVLSPIEWVVRPGEFIGGADVDCGLAGTVMRFVPPIAALAAGATHFDGDERARERPMAGLLDSLRTVGVEVDDAGRGTLPFTIHGRGGVKGGTTTIDASASSQFVSGLLLAGSRYDEGLIVHHVGEHLPSLPHIDMTIATLADFDIKAERIGPASWQVEPGTPAGGGTYIIEPDLSNAAPFLAAALVTGGAVKVADWPEQTSQPGVEIRVLLERLGATVALTAEGLTVTSSGTVHGIDADLSGVSELATTIAAVALFGDGPTTISGIAHTRGHETDRIAALVNEINGLGGNAVETVDGLIITPTTMHGGVWHSYADHRMATAGAIVGLAVPGVVIDDIESTSKTMPSFPSLWARLVAGEVA